MRLVLYSGGTSRENRALDLTLMEIVHRPNPSVLFIPTSFEHADEDFQSFCDYYRIWGWNDFQIFPIDVPFDRNALPKLLKRDVIYLAGGNTFYFLKHLRRSGMLKELTNFVKRGGILTGQSAGSIVMTPTIHTAGFPSFDADENDVRLKNLKAMGLVNFEFFPHYESIPKYRNEMLRYSRKSGNLLVASPDGGGVVVNGKAISFVGEVELFFKGRRISLAAQGALK